MTNTTTTMTFTNKELEAAINKILQAVEEFSMPLAALAMQEILTKLEESGAKIVKSRIIQ